MTPRDAQQIADWTRHRTAPLKVALAEGKGEAAGQLSLFFDRLRALAPIVEKHSAPEDPFRAPALIVGRHANIAYQAIPEGAELEPFLMALAGETEPTLGAPAGMLEQIEAIELPADLTLFISMQCPHCPTVAAQLVAMANASPRVRLTVIDAMLFNGPAQEQGIRSVPTLILDEGVRWTGQIRLAEVLRQCIQRDPSQLSAASLRQIIESGEAARAAAMMAAHGRYFPALLDLLTSERWSVRLGAMVAVEYLVEEAPQPAADMVLPLWQRFPGLNESVQGDVVQVISQIGGVDALRCLHHIVSGDFPESVREAAAEELENQTNG